MAIFSIIFFRVVEGAHGEREVLIIKPRKKLRNEEGKIEQITKIESNEMKEVNWRRKD
jgi:hypothetical protein